jgi:hypothetical protein
MTNLTVSTPIGEGTLQIARFMVGRDKTFRYLVRLNVTPEVRGHLGDGNCLTKKAKHTALFSFTAQELGLTDQD